MSYRYYHHQHNHLILLEAFAITTQPIQNERLTSTLSGDIITFLELKGVIAERRSLQIT